MKTRLLVIALLISGCATYSSQTRMVRNTLEQGSPQEALNLLDESVVAKQRRNEVLYRMERGMLHYVNGDYQKAALDWEKSFYRSEELYTTSLSKTAASLSVSGDYSDYEGEDHERVLLPIFSSLAFFAMGNLNSALVEVRRAYGLINKLKLDKSENESRIDGFAFLISGLLYESNGNWDSAIIEYSKALRFYDRQNWQSSDGILKLTADSLWRIAEFRGRKEIVQQLERDGFSRPSNTLREVLAKGEAILVVESGQSPVKIPRDHIISHAAGVVNLSFPQYQPITNTASSNAFKCDDNICGRTAQATDIGILAVRSLENRRIRDFAKMTARLLVKEGARRMARERLGELGGFAVMLAGAATERADTRSWTLLPENVQIARIPLPADTPVRLSINLSSSLGQDTWTLRIPAGKKKLIRVRSMY